MANMKNSILSLKTKEEDAVKCTLCNRGIMIPSNPEAKKIIVSFVIIVDHTLTLMKMLR